jgi:hypothetical protein
MIPIVCPSCRKKFAIHEEMRGKATTCPNCNVRMRIGQKAGDTAPPSSSPTKAARPSEASRPERRDRAAERNDDEDNGRAGRPTKRRPTEDVSDEGPGNARSRRRRVEEDDEDRGAERRRPRRDVDDEEDDERRDRRRRRRDEDESLIRSKQKGLRREKAASGPLYWQFLLGLGVVVVVLGVVALAVQSELIVLAIIGIGATLVLVGSLWFLHGVSNDDATEGLKCILCSPYALYYVVANWHEGDRVQKPVAMWFLGWLIMLFSLLPITMVRPKDTALPAPVFPAPKTKTENTERAFCHAAFAPANSVR